MADEIALRGVIQGSAAGVGKEPGDARAEYDCTTFQQLQVATLMNGPRGQGNL
jgi:hypothetical protein